MQANNCSMPSTQPLIIIMVHRLAWPASQPLPSPPSIYDLLYCSPWFTSLESICSHSFTAALMQSLLLKWYCLSKPSNLAALMPTVSPHSFHFTDISSSSLNLWSTPFSSLHLMMLSLESVTAAPASHANTLTCCSHWQLSTQPLLQPSEVSWLVVIIIRGEFVLATVWTSGYRGACQHVHCSYATTRRGIIWGGKQSLVEHTNCMDFTISFDFYSNNYVRLATALRLQASRLQFPLNSWATTCITFFFKKHADCSVEMSTIYSVVKDQLKF